MQTAYRFFHFFHLEMRNEERKKYPSILIFHFQFSTFNFSHSACGFHVEYKADDNEHDNDGTDGGSTAAATIRRSAVGSSVSGRSVSSGMTGRGRRGRRSVTSAESSATGRWRGWSVTSSGRWRRSVSSAHGRSWWSVHKIISVKIFL